MIPELFVPNLLHLIYDEVIAGHPGMQSAPVAACSVLYWPTMHLDIEAYI